MRTFKESQVRGFARAGSGVRAENLEAPHASSARPRYVVWSRSASSMAAFCRSTKNEREVSPVRGPQRSPGIRSGLTWASFTMKAPERVTRLPEVRSTACPGVAPPRRRCSGAL